MNKRKVYIILLILVFVLATGLYVISSFKDRDKKTTNSDDNQQVLEDDNTINTEGLYSYLLKNDDSYTLVLSNNQTVSEKNVASDIVYVPYDYLEASYDEKSQSYKVNGPKWYFSEDNIKVTKVLIKNKILPTKTSYWFMNFNNLTTIEGLNNIDFSNVKSTAGMFYGCSSLRSLDLSSFDMKNVISTNGMFFNCNSLKKIYVSKSLWNLDNVNDSNGMFFNTINLIGGIGTKFDSNYTDKTYARIDSKEKPGYLTNK